MSNLISTKYSYVQLKPLQAKKWNYPELLLRLPKRGFTLRAFHLSRFRRLRVNDDFTWRSGTVPELKVGLDAGPSEHFVYVGQHHLRFVIG